MFEIFKKEVSIYFLTPFGFVFIGIFLLLSGIVFTIYNLAGGRSDINGMLGILNFLSIVAFPVLTMKLLAEEKRVGTEQLLFTSPISITAIIVGKYLAAIFVFLIALLSTSIFVVFILIYGEISFGAIVGGYLGFFLLGSSFIAITLFSSSFVDNQVTAAITGFGSLLIFMFIGMLGDAIHIPILKKIISWLAILNRFDDFSRGVLKLDSLIYYLSFSFLFVYFSIIVVQVKHWNKEG